jgi:hypothetical protein
VSACCVGDSTLTPSLLSGVLGTLAASSLATADLYVSNATSESSVTLRTAPLRTPPEPTKRPMRVMRAVKRQHGWPRASSFATSTKLPQRTRRLLM